MHTYIRTCLVAALLCDPHIRHMCALRTSLLYPPANKYKHITYCNEMCTSTWLPMCLCGSVRPLYTHICHMYVYMYVHMGIRVLYACICRCMCVCMLSKLSISAICACAANVLEQYAHSTHAFVSGMCTFMCVNMCVYLSTYVCMLLSMYLN